MNNQLELYSKPDSLKGVVTAYNQTMKRRDSDGLDLRDIFLNDEIRNKFPKHTFPGFEITSDNKIFIIPSKHVISTMENYYIKWLVLDENRRVIHGHDYPMVELPKKGYLMKVVLPITSENPRDYEIMYMADIHHVSIITISEITKETMYTENPVSVEKWNVEQFNEAQRSSVYEMISNQTEFFNKYIEHILE